MANISNALKKSGGKSSAATASGLAYDGLTYDKPTDEVSEPEVKDRLKKLIDFDDGTPANQASQAALAELRNTGTTTYNGATYNKRADIFADRTPLAAVEDVGKVKRTSEDAQADIDALMPYLYQIGGYGEEWVTVNPKAQERIDALEAEKAALEKEEKNNSYAAILNMPDFAQYSVAGESKRSDTDQDWWNPKTWFNKSDDVYDYINDINGYRDTVFLASVMANSQNDYEKYDYLTAGEIGTYNYLYATEGRESAEAYLDSLSDGMAQRQGEMTAWLLEGKPGREAAYNFGAGVESALLGIAQFFSGNALTTTSTQYAKQIIDEDLKNYPVAKFGADLLYTAGNMLPSILLSSVGSGVLSAAGVSAGTAAKVASAFGASSLGASASGNAYKEKLDEGYTKQQARTYATLIGASEAGLQYLLGGVSSLGGVSAEKLALKISGIDNALARIALTGAVKMNSEGVEEALQTQLQPILETLVLGTEYNPATFEDTAYSYLLGAITAGVFEAGNIAASGRSAANTETSVQEAGAGTAPGPVNAADLLAEAATGTKAETPVSMPEPASAPQTAASPEVLTQPTPGAESDSGEFNTPQTRMGSQGAVDAIIDAVSQGSVDAEAGKTAVAALLGSTNIQSNIDNADAEAYNNTVDSSIGGDESVGAETARPGGGVSSVQESDSGVAGIGNPGRGDSGLAGRSLVADTVRSTLDSKGVVNLGLSESTGDNAFFSSALEAAKQTQTYGSSVSSKSESELVGSRLFITSDGSAGFAVTQNGDIEAVFRNKQTGAKGALPDMLVTAISNGGVKLDCYGIRLVNQYAAAGFVPVAQVTFNPDYIPLDWSPAMGEPNIYFMMSNGDSAETVARKYGDYPAYTQAQLDALPNFGKDGYDQAAEYRDGLQEKRNTRGPAAKSGLPEGLGAMSNSYPTEQKRSRTESNTLQTVEERAGVPEDERTPLYYDTMSEAQSLANAAQRLDLDYEGEMNELAEKSDWSGEDLDTAMGIREKLRQDAENAGDWTAYKAWRKTIQEHGTETGRALQAYAKYSRTGAQALSDAVETLENSGLPEARQTVALDQISQFAEEYDGLADGDKATLIDLIKRQADYRKTSTFVKGNFGKLLEAVANTDGGYSYLHDYAFQQLSSMASDQIGTSAGSKIKTLQVLSHLTSMGTTLRNLGGNLSFGLMDTMTQDGLALAIDRAVSNATGKKTVSFDRGWFSSAARQGAVDAMQKSILEVAGDVDMTGQTNRYGTGTGRSFKMIGGPVSRFFSRWEQLLNYALHTTDRFSRGAIEGELTRGLTAVEDSGLTSDEVDALASSAADYRLFQNEGTAAGISKGIHDTLNLLGVGGEVQGTRRMGGFGLGDLVNPYPKVPANLGVKALEYSPANIIKGGIELIQTFQAAKDGTLTAQQQNTAVMDIARGMAGTPIVVLLAAIARAGLIRNAEDEEDYDVAAMNAAENKSGTQLNLSAALRWLNGGDAAWRDGDKLLSIGWLEPLNAFMAIATLCANDAEDATLWDYAGNYAEGAIQAFLEIPVMENLQTFFDTLQYSTADTMAGTVGEAAADYLTSTLTGFIPAPIRQIAKGTDPYYRDTSGDNLAEEVINALLYAIPGARETLPEKLDNFGNPREYGGTTLENILNALVLPGPVNTLNQSAVSSELETLYEALGISSVYPDRKAPGSLSYGGEKLELTTDEKRAYQQTAGQVSYALMDSFMQSDIYDQLSDEQKAAVLEQINAYAGDRAKKDLVEGRGGTYESEWDDETTLGRVSDLPTYLAYKGAFSAMYNSGGEDSEDFKTLMESYDDLDGDTQEALQNVDGFKTAYAVYQAGAKYAGGADMAVYYDLKGAVTALKESGGTDTAAFDETYAAYKSAGINIQKTVADNIDGFGKLQAALTVGVSPEDYYTAYAKYQEIGEGDETATDKATAFAHWLDTESGLTSAQRATLNDQLKYFTHVPGEASSYDALKTAGLSYGQADRVYETVSALAPEAGAENVSYAQKYAAISGLDMSDDEKLAALSIYATEAAYEKYQGAAAAGISVSDWTQFTETLSGIDVNNNVSQAELRTALSQTDWDYATRRAAWNIYREAKNWKAYY